MTGLEITNEFLQWNWNCDILVSFVQSRTSVGSGASRCSMPKVLLVNRIVHITDLEHIVDSVCVQPPGTVLEIGDNFWNVAAVDGVVKISSFLDEFGQQISAQTIANQCNIIKGSQLPTITSEIQNQSTTTIQSNSVSTISFWMKIGYGLGHVYNDLCAGVWFSYLLLFMNSVLCMDGAKAGAMMMVGQVGDALATPVVGFLVDKYATKHRWHIFGTFLVLITFPMIFSLCPKCNVWPYWWQIAYFSVVIIIFQIGWPMVQVSHLAIIPEMARTQKDRSALTSIRYSVSVISNVIVFITTWLMLRANRIGNDQKITSEDAYRFRDISLILTLIGICMSVMFYFSLYKNRQTSLEPKSSHRRLSETNSKQSPSIDQSEAHRKKFIKSAKLYQYSLLYVFSRIFGTTALVYIPLWLDDRLNQESTFENGSANTSVEHIATVPMVSFVASFISSVFIDQMQHLLSHNSWYFLGSLISFGGCILIETTISSAASNVLLYFIASLFGAGSSITMVSSLCLIANMIGKHADQSGFVYSAVTFADKLITGVAVLAFESLKCSDRALCPNYYKNVLARACGGAAVLGILTLFTLFFNRSKGRTNDAKQQD